MTVKEFQHEFVDNGNLILFGSRAWNCTHTNEDDTGLPWDNCASREESDWDYFTTLPYYAHVVSFMTGKEIDFSQSAYFEGHTFQLEDGKIQIFPVLDRFYNNWITTKDIMTLLADRGYLQDLPKNQRHGMVEILLGALKAIS